MSTNNYIDDHTRLIQACKSGDHNIIIDILSLYCNSIYNNSNQIDNHPGTNQDTRCHKCGEICGCRICFIKNLNNYVNNSSLNQHQQQFNNVDNNSKDVYNNNDEIQEVVTEHKDETQLLIENNVDMITMSSNSNTLGCNCKLNFINGLDDQGMTALHHSSRSHDNKAVEILVHHGANVNITNNDGKTALHFAMGLEFDICGKENLELVRMLVEVGGADITIQDELGFTPSYYASRNGRFQIIQWLLDYEYNNNVNNNNNNSNNNNNDNIWNSNYTNTLPTTSTSTSTMMVINNQQINKSNIFNNNPNRMIRNTQHNNNILVQPIKFLISISYPLIGLISDILCCLPMIDQQHPMRYQSNTQSSQSRALPSYPPALTTTSTSSSSSTTINRGTMSVTH